MGRKKKQSPAETGPRPSNRGRSIFSLPEDARAYYMGHCYEFVCDLILAPVWDKIKPSSQQKELMDAYDKYQRVLVDSGHGSGKSTGLSWIGIHFLETRPSPCRVPCTAPTGHQLKDVLWANLTRWIGTSYVSDDLEWMATEVRHRFLKAPHFMLARTSNKSANMQGQHEQHMLWIVDECYGIVDPLIWEVIDGSMTEDDNHIIMGGQPTLVSGYCAEARHAKPEKNPEWAHPKGVTLRFDSTKSTLVKPSWVEGMFRKYGRESDVCRVRVRGLPPLGNPKAFITLAQVMQAVGREIPKDGMFELGLDPAREGDDLAVLATRKGYFYFPLETQPKSDEFSMTAMVLNRVRLIRKEFDYSNRIKVKIENIGGYGGGVIDILRRNRTDNIEVVPITGGGTGNSEYATATTVMWAEFRDAIEKMHLPEDDDLIGQLATREYDIDDKTGRVIIEPKKKYKKRHGGESPDRADAVILCWTRQAIKNRMLDFEAGECMTKLNIRWGSLSPSTRPIISVWMGERNTMGVVVSIWKPETRKLYVVYSYEFERAFPEMVVPAINATMIMISKGRVKKTDKFEWYGNKPFDEAGMGSVRDAWTRCGINVRFNSHHTFDGAIMAMGRMFQRQTLIFDELHSGQLPVLMQSWFAEDGDDTSPMILALANTVSLFYDERVTGDDNPLVSYTERKVEAQVEAEKQAAVGERINMDTEITAEGWMS